MSVRPKKQLGQLLGAEELLIETNMLLTPAYARAVTGMIFGWMLPSFCRAL